MAFGPLKEGSNKATSGKGKGTAKSSSQTLWAENANRVQLIIQNWGSNDAWVAFAETAASGEGLRLKKEGGQVTVDNYSGPVSVITESGESNLTYVEI
jgi:hypothetical protein